MWEVYVHFCLLLLNILVWVTRYRYFSTALRLLGWALLFTALVETYAAYLLLNKIRNLHLYHLLTPVQYAFYTLVFTQALEGRKLRYLLLLSIPLYVLTSVLITLFVQGLSEYNSYALSLKNVALVCWVLLYYRDVFARLQVVRLNRHAMFWVSTGLLFYSLGSFFVDGVMHYVLSESFKMANALFYISIFLGYLLHGTFLIAFVLACKKDCYALEDASS